MLSFRIVEIIWHKNSICSFFFVFFFLSLVLSFPRFTEFFYDESKVLAAYLLFLHYSYSLLLLTLSFFLMAVFFPSFSFVSSTTLNRSRITAIHLAYLKSAPADSAFKNLEKNNKIRTVGILSICLMSVSVRKLCVSF